MADDHDVPPLDPVSKGFASTGFSTLESAAGEFPVSSRTPSSVASLLERSRRQFTTAGVDYDNFVSCVETSFKAIEVLLRERLGELAPKKRGLNAYAEKLLKEGILSNRDAKYLKELVIEFRNQMAHGTDLRFTPGMAQEVLAGSHQFVASFSEAQYPAEPVR